MGHKYEDYYWDGEKIVGKQWSMDEGRKIEVGTPVT